MSRGRQEERKRDGREGRRQEGGERRKGGRRGSEGGGAKWSGGQKEGIGHPKITEQKLTAATIGTASLLSCLVPISEAAGVVPPENAPAVLNMIHALAPKHSGRGRTCLMRAEANNVSGAAMKYFSSLALASQKC